MMFQVELHQGGLAVIDMSIDESEQPAHGKNHSRDAKHPDRCQALIDQSAAAVELLFARQQGDEKERKQGRDFIFQALGQGDDGTDRQQDLRHPPGFGQTARQGPPQQQQHGAADGGKHMRRLQYRLRQDMAEDGKTPPTSRQSA